MVATPMLQLQSHAVDRFAVPVVRSAVSSPIDRAIFPKISTSSMAFAKNKETQAELPGKEATELETETETEMASPGRLDTEEDLRQLLQYEGGRVRAALLFRFRPALKAEDIEEILSLALQKAWQSRTQHDPAKGTLRAWFYCIAQRTAIDRLKSAATQRRLREVEWDAAADAFSAADSPEAAVGTLPTEDESTDPGADTAKSALKAALLNAMASLPEMQRRILWADALGSGGGQPPTSEELGAELGLPAATVRVYRKRGMEKLRSLMQAAVEAQTKGVTP